MGDFLQPWHLIVLFFVFGLFLLLPTIFYLLTLQKALSQCGPASRTMEPGMVWLCLVPLVSLVFQFFVVSAISKSLTNEFATRGTPTPDQEPGHAVGLAMCICACCSIIPLVGFFAGIAYLVLWIMYWVKIADYSRRLSILSAGAAAI